MPTPIVFTQDESILRLVATPVDQFGNPIPIDSAMWSVENPALLTIQNQSGNAAQFTHPDHTTLGATRVIFSFTGGQITADISVTAGGFAGGAIVKV